MELIVRHRGREEKVHLERSEAGYRISIGERVYEVDAAEAGPGLKSLLISGQQHEVAVRDEGDGRYWVSTAGGGGEQVELLDPLAHLAEQSHGEGGSAGRREVCAYMPGRVVQVLVEEGQEVAAGDGLVVLEAMKMENEIQAEHPGRILEILVENGQAVEGGDPMFVLE